MTTGEQERLKSLEQEDHALRRATESVREASACCAGGARPPSDVMVAVIDAHRAAFGFEASGAVAPIAPPGGSCGGAAWCRWHS
jgi:hypothetical protein